MNIISIFHFDNYHNTKGISDSKFQGDSHVKYVIRYKSSVDGITH